MRLLDGLKAISGLLRAYEVHDWADRFAGDLEDYLAAKDPPRQLARQRAVIEHVLMAFGGMSAFRHLELVDEDSIPSPEANERLHTLAEQIWTSARSLQGFLSSVDTDKEWL